MKSLYFCCLSYLILLSCTKEPDKVPEYKYPSCAGTITYRKDTTLIKIDSTDITVFFDDSSNVFSNNYRMDVRMYDNSGKFLMIVLRDYKKMEELTPGTYHPDSANRNGRIYHYFPNYAKSNYLVDSTSFFLSKYDTIEKTFSMNFSARLIDTLKKDTVRIRQGIITDMCFKERNN